MAAARCSRQHMSSQNMSWHERAPETGRVRPPTWPSSSANARFCAILLIPCVYTSERIMRSTGRTENLPGPSQKRGVKPLFARLAGARRCTRSNSIWLCKSRLSGMRAQTCRAEVQFLAPELWVLAKGLHRSEPGASFRLAQEERTSLQSKKIYCMHGEGGCVRLGSHGTEHSIGSFPSGLSNPPVSSPRRPLGACVVYCFEQPWPGGNMVSDAARMPLLSHYCV